jgi:hypothetical protein
MRLKSELYKKEQEEIVDKIITILDLENKTEYTLFFVYYVFYNIIFYVPYII